MKISEIKPVKWRFKHEKERSQEKAKSKKGIQQISEHRKYSKVQEKYNTEGKGFFIDFRC